MQPSSDLIKKMITELEESVLDVTSSYTSDQVITEDIISDIDECVRDAKSKSFLIDYSTVLEKKEYYNILSALERLLHLSEQIVESNNHSVNSRAISELSKALTSRPFKTRAIIEGALRIIARDL